MVSYSKNIKRSLSPLIYIFYNENVNTEIYFNYLDNKNPGLLKNILAKDVGKIHPVHPLLK